jgi:hypothetical protein
LEPCSNQHRQNNWRNNGRPRYGNIRRPAGLAEASPGFVWRLKDEGNNATAFNPYNDNRIIVNMSLWETLDHLMQYVYKGRHAEVLRSRREWFVNFGKPFTTMWYVPAGKIPTIEEAMERLQSLQDHGPTPFAFDFKTKFPEPAEIVTT